MKEPPKARSEPLGPERPSSPVPARPGAHLAEPPAFRPHPAGGPLACTNCATAIPSAAAASRCWGCGRPLCTECYWQHGLAPSAHRCTSCLAHRPAASVAISGGRSVAPAGLTGTP